MALLSPTEACILYDISFNHNIFHKTVIPAGKNIKEIFNSVNTFFNNVIFVADIFHFKFTRCIHLVGNSRIVGLIDMAVFNLISVTSSVNFNAVSITGDTSAPSLRVVRIGTVIMLYVSANPADFAVCDRQSFYVPRSLNAEAVIFKAEVVYSYIVFIGNIKGNLPYNSFNTIKSSTGISLVASQIKLTLGVFNFRNGKTFAL